MKQENAERSRKMYKKIKNIKEKQENAQKSRKILKKGGKCSEK